MEGRDTHDPILPCPIAIPNLTKSALFGLLSLLRLYIILFYCYMRSKIIIPSLSKPRESTLTTSAKLTNLLCLRIASLHQEVKANNSSQRNKERRGYHYKTFADVSPSLTYFYLVVLLFLRKSKIIICKEWL